MGKAIEKRYYNKDDSMYLVMIDNTITGLFDSENNQVALVTIRVKLTLITKYMLLDLLKEKVCVCLLK